jgi:hypothetical protein
LQDAILISLPKIDRELFFSGALRVLGIATTQLLQISSSNQFGALSQVLKLQVRFSKPKLHVRLVLKKWAWHISGKLAVNCLFLMYEFETGYSKKLFVAG